MMFVLGSHFMRDILKAAEQALKDGASHERVAGYLEDLAADIREGKEKDDL